MKKKPVRRSSYRRSSKRQRPNDRYIQFFGIGLGMIIGVLAVAGYDSADKPYVLGTSVFLARGDSERGNNRPEENKSGPSIESGARKLPPKETSLSEGKGNVSPGTLVDCVNPAGKHVQVSMRGCEEMNKNRSTFKFTVLKTDERIKSSPSAMANKLERELREGSESGKTQKQRGKRPGSKEEKDLQTSPTEIEITRGKERLEIRKKGAENNEGMDDGALEELNKELDALDVELEAVDSNDIVIRKNNVQAQTPFPLSMDPATKKFLVMMTSGKKELSVMPDEAVERLLQTRTLSAVENQASARAGGSASHTTLTELNNEAVFKVKGFSHKKVFGLFPASFAKTVYVSAEDGTVVKTDETFFTKALEAVSF